MRKNAPRKWLHAVLDLLPVIMIPVFMIYSHRHSSGTNMVLEQPIYYDSKEVTSSSDVDLYNIYLYNTTGDSNATGFIAQLNKELMLEQLTDIYNISYLEDEDNAYLYIGTNNVYIYFRESPYTYDTDIYKGLANNNLINIIFENVIDQTRYNNYINANYSQFSETSYKFVRDYVELTVENTITDAFIIQFNETVDKYFNMGNVFNLNGVYNWFNTNIFNGDAPQIVYSVWNIALYEFVMDLLFLLYALFMFFIDFCTSLIERCYVSGKGGK